MDQMYSMRPGVQIPMPSPKQNMFESRQNQRNQDKLEYHTYLLSIICAEVDLTAHFKSHFIF
jgi:hypothetical protein